MNAIWPIKRYVDKLLGVFLTSDLKSQVSTGAFRLLVGKLTQCKPNLEHHRPIASLITPYQKRKEIVPAW